MKSINIILTYAIFLIISMSFLSCTDQQKNEQNLINNPKILYNGIELPDEWPPRYGVPEKATAMPVPYLENPPEFIPINIGRQLFVDDFLITKKENIVRIYHYPAYSKLNPILEQDKEWELNGNGDPYAAPFSGGVWYDELATKYKMWYSAGGKNHEDTNDGLITCYAESDDGINWTKPNVGLFENENVVDITSQDCLTIWLDKSEKDLTKRYKMFVNEFYEPGKVRMLLKYSADGIHWSDPVATSNDLFDRCSAWYNPFTEKYVLSLKTKTDLGRSRLYVEDKNPEQAVNKAGRYPNEQIRFWFTAWPNELTHPDYPTLHPEIYNHDAIAYESLTLGFFTVWKGPENDICDELGIQKRNEVSIGYSRDGFHWVRPDINPFLPVNQTTGAWNWGNVQSSNGSPIMKGDSLYFYVSGRKNNPDWDTNMATGLATLRRDGFASLDATEKEGIVITRKLTFKGKHLFVNADASKGQLLAELLDENGNVVKGYSKEDCIPVAENGTKINVLWKGNKQLKSFSKPFKVKFYLTNSSLYSFWVSEYKTGESGGYTAGGGSGFHPSGQDMPVK